MNETQKTMTGHVSVRNFTAQAIPSDMLQRLIVCGQSASSSSFIQAYSLIRVVDSDKRQQIAAAAGNQQWIIQAAEFLVFCADMLRIEYCCQKAGQGGLEGYCEHFVTATIDTALMAQNVMLAAESEGLGGVFIGGIRNNPAQVSECLQLPRHVYPAFGMCLGWPEKRQSVKPRMPLHDILHVDRYETTRVERQVDEYDRTMARYYAGRRQNARSTDWSRQTASAVQGKKREHMLDFLHGQGYLLR